MNDLMIDDADADTDDALTGDDGLHLLTDEERGAIVSLQSAFAQIGTQLDVHVCLTYPNDVRPDANSKGIICISLVDHACGRAIDFDEHADGRWIGRDRCGDADYDRGPFNIAVEANSLRETLRLFADVMRHDMRNALDELASIPPPAANGVAIAA